MKVSVTQFLPVNYIIISVRVSQSTSLSYCLACDADKNFWINAHYGFSYKTLDKHLKRAVWVIHIWALRWISKGWSGSHTSVWWPPKACISAQGGSAFLSSPSATPQCTDVSSGTVSWSKELTQGWNNQQIRESGEKNNWGGVWREKRQSSWVSPPSCGRNLLCLAVLTWLQHYMQFQTL